MSLTSIDLWQRLVAEGLASPMQCRSWASDVSKVLPAAATADGLKVLQSLIDAGKLTKYQAKILAGQSSDPLKRGPWHVLSKVKQPPWQGWLEVTKIDTTKGDLPMPTWARWLTVAELNAIQSSAPSLPRGIQLANVRSEHLQSVEMPELIEGELLLRVHPVAGSSLLKLYATSRPSADLTMQIVQETAMALAAMHEKQVVHGRVTPDRIFWDSVRGVTLVRDPISFWTAGVDPSMCGILGEQLPGPHTASFLAPEFLAPKQPCSLQSDIYALGATWWWLLTGTAPFEGNSLAGTLGAAAEISLDMVGKLPKTPEPLRLCLQHCLAKNPSARFASAGQLCHALAAAQRSLAKGKVMQTAPLVTVTSATPVTAQVVEPTQQHPDTLQPAETMKLAETTNALAVNSNQLASAERPIKSFTDVAQQPKPQSNGGPIGTAASRPNTRRFPQRKSKTPLFVMAGFGFLALLLSILKFSGALDSRTPAEAARSQQNQPLLASNQPKTVNKDPLQDLFRIMDSREAVWAPPVAPDPMPLDLLPPGAQIFLALRPADLLAKENSLELIRTFQKHFQLDQLLNQMVARSGQPLESIQSIVIAYYGASMPEQIPDSALRVELLQPLSLVQLKAQWSVTSEVVVDQQRLYITDEGQAFLVLPDQPANAVTKYSTGPVDIMREAAQMGGAAGPLSAQLKLLHNRSSKSNHFAVLGSPRFLFAEGRGLARQLPNRFQSLLEPILSKDARVALLQVSLADRCYWELQLVGATDASTPQLVSNLNSRASAAANDIENWFVSQSPDPYWRALAFRFPQMLRTWREYARFGIEDGVGLANGYLPADAATNLLVATWIAMQEGATMAGQLPATNNSVAGPTKTISPEEILNQTIRLSFDQEPIERALALVEEVVNAAIPVDSQIRFELDGGAFERAGITRNQQLREFRIDNLPARNALTEIAKRGNPVTTVKDTRDLDQRLIWVIKEDPKNLGKMMVSLTTRDAATTGGNTLPIEFAPQP